MKKRIIFNFILLGAVFYTPWWVVAVLAFVGVFLFPFYYEIIMAGLLVDLLYGANSFTVGGILGTLSAVVIFFIVTYIRKMVR